MNIDSLISHLPPPKNPQETGSSKAWEKIEARLGIALPPDYKTFIDTYGTGSFDDFIMVYNPFAENEYLNLFYALDVLHQAARPTRWVGDSAWTAVHPFELYPAAEGLLPWGCTSNFGDFFFWQIIGSPSIWETVFYNLRNGEYEIWKRPMTGFLLALFDREIESVLLPVDYPPVGGQVNFIPAFV